MRRRESGPRKIAENAKINLDVTRIMCEPVNMTTTLYRGDTSRPVRPEITAGTWLTESAEVAAWYGNANRYELDLHTLDLTDLGVGDGDDSAQVEALREKLVDAGVNVDGLRLHLTEIYMVVEEKEAQAAIRAGGFDSVAVEQWNADLSDEPYTAILYLGEA